MRYALPVSVSLLTAIAVQLACQAFKVVLYSLRDRKLRLSYFLSAGGMPSAHTAFVTALTVSVGLWNGFASEIFAVSCTFAAIVLYDAFRLRGAVGEHARIINALLLKHPDVQAGSLSEKVGHSLGELIAGMAVGGGFAILVHSILAS